MRRMACVFMEILANGLEAGAILHQFGGMYGSDLGRQVRAEKREWSDDLEAKG